MATKKSTPHDLLIARVQATDPRLRRTGFRSALLDLIAKQEDNEEERRDDREYFKEVISFVPDLFLIDEDCGDVLVIEVEHTLSVPAHKRWNMARLA